MQTKRYKPIFKKEKGKKIKEMMYPPNHISPETGREFEIGRARDAEAYNDPSYEYYDADMDEYGNTVEAPYDELDTDMDTAREMERYDDSTEDEELYYPDNEEEVVSQYDDIDEDDDDSESIMFDAGYAKGYKDAKRELDMDVDDDMNVDDMEFFTAYENTSKKRNKNLSEEEEKKEDKKKVKVKDIIKEVISTSWSKDNESQMKILQLLKGIATSDEDAANKFMKKIDAFTSGLKIEEF